MKKPRLAIFWTIGHYSKKLHCGRMLKKLSRPFLTSAICQESKPLESFWPDCGESCLCDNCVSSGPSYDLQVVVPCYNVAEYVNECVDSILTQQTRFSFKTVIINDGSTDGTEERILQYVGRENVEVIHQKNKGLSGARNTGIKTIDARYVMYVDSDDVLCPGAIESLMTKAQALDADIVEGGFERFCGPKILSVNAPQDMDNNRWISGFAWGKVYKASLWQNVCFPGRYWFEDSVIYHVILPMAKIVASVPNVVYRWRKNATSITASYKKNYKSVDSFWVTRRMAEDREALGLDVDNDYVIIFLAQVRHNFQRCAQLFDDELNKSIFSATRQLFLDHIAGRCAHDESELEQALANNDYGQYLLCCFFD